MVCSAVDDMRAFTTPVSDGLMRAWQRGRQTFDLDLEQIGGRKKNGPGRSELTCGEYRGAPQVVHAIDFLDAPAVHHAIFATFSRRRRHLLRRAERSPRPLPVKVPRFGQILRRPQKHRPCGPSWPQGVHSALGVFGGIVQPGLLVDRQRVHICAASR